MPHTVTCIILKHRKQGTSLVGAICAEKDGWMELNKRDDTAVGFYEMEDMDVNSGRPY